MKENPINFSKIFKFTSSSLEIRRSRYFIKMLTKYLVFFAVYASQAISAAVGQRLEKRSSGTLPFDFVTHRELSSESLPFLSKRDTQVMNAIHEKLIST